MPYDNNKRAINGRTTANPPAALRSNQGPYIAPRLAVSSLSASSSEVGRTVRPRVVTKEEAATPVKAFLSSNITPRSSSRRTRADVASDLSTPGGTPGGSPSSSRPPSMVAFKAPDDGAPELGREHGRSGSVVSSEPSSAVSYRGLSPELAVRTSTSSESPPMFFLASEVKPQSTRHPSITARILPFVYADGKQEMQTVDTLISGIKPPNKGTRPKSYDGAQEIRARAGNVTSTSSDRRSARESSPPGLIPRAVPGVASRSKSPMKGPETVRKTSIPQQQKRRSLAGTDPSLEPPQPISLSTAHSEVEKCVGQNLNSFNRGKSHSDVAIGSRPERKTSVPIAGSLSLLTSQSPSQKCNKIQTRIPVVVPISPQSNPVSPTSPVTSPIRSIESKIDQLNALAANARRERKVLDLEISNSSLLAINRTLERKMRKQTAELRRYRRLTSAGRIPIAASKRSASAAVGGSEADDPDAESGPDDNGEEEDEDDASDLSAGTLSPGAQAAHDARQHQKDEKRLQLDLSKHQQLLLDSQRMNQSLKRCLGWTEALIKEGKKALAYEVKPGDLEVGGRVLDEEELGTVLGQRRGLLSAPQELPPAMVWRDEGRNSGARSLMGEVGVDEDSSGGEESTGSDEEPL